MDRVIGMAGSGIGQRRLWMGDPAAGLPAFRQELALRQKLADRSPNDVIYQMALTFPLELIGQALGSCDFVSMGDWKGAEAAFRRVLVIEEKISVADPHDYRVQLGLVSVQPLSGAAGSPS